MMSKLYFRIKWILRSCKPVNVWPGKWSCLLDCLVKKIFWPKHQHLEFVIFQSIPSAVLALPPVQSAHATQVWECLLQVLFQPQSQKLQQKGQSQRAEASNLERLEVTQREELSVQMRLETIIGASDGASSSSSWGTRLCQRWIKSNGKLPSSQPNS